MLNNPNFFNLKTNYLFSHIHKKVQAFRSQYPQHSVIDLSIGNTTQPLDPSVVEAFQQSIQQLGCAKQYQGYGSEFGLVDLRKGIASVIYNDLISSQEVFISDGAKVDIFRLFSLFGPGKVVAVQDPSYPAYIDTAYLTGAHRVLKLSCTKEHNFFPQIPEAEKIDIFCICSPNNPTGTVLNHEQLQAIVDYACSHQSLILFDAAYSAFISDPSLPRSIFEIPRARSCAIEINSFSKSLGFTGVRLGWTIVPQELLYADGSPVFRNWERFLCTTFNGASLPAQQAALQGLSLFPKLPAIQYYQENSRLLKRSLQDSGFKVFGGEHAPYLWVEISHIKDEDIFDFFLNEYHIATTPGSGFGECGKGFVRFSALGKREQVLDACQRLSTQSLCLV